MGSLECDIQEVLQTGPHVFAEQHDAMEGVSMLGEMTDLSFHFILQEACLGGNEQHFPRHP